MDKQQKGGIVNDLIFAVRQMGMSLASTSSLQSMEMAMPLLMVVSKAAIYGQNPSI